MTVNQSGTDGAYLYVSATSTNYLYVDQNSLSVDAFAPGTGSGTQLNYGDLSDAGDIAVTVTPNDASIQETGFEPVFFGGFNLVSVFTTTGSIGVVGTGSTNTLTVTPLTAVTASIATGSNIDPNFLLYVGDVSTTGTLTVDPADATASIVLNGSGNVADTVTVAGETPTADVVSVSGLLPITLVPADQGVLTINGGNGNDTLTVNSSVAPVDMPIAFNGGVGTNSITLTGGTAHQRHLFAGPRRRCRSFRPRLWRRPGRAYFLHRP